MFAENLDVFFADFGEVVSLGGEREITGIFDCSDLAGRLGDGFTLHTRANVLVCRTADVVEVAADADVKVRGEKYVVLENHPDGTGISVLVLTPVPVL